MMGSVQFAYRENLDLLVAISFDFLCLLKIRFLRSMKEFDGLILACEHYCITPPLRETCVP